MYISLYLICILPPYIVTDFLGVRNTCSHVKSAVFSNMMRLYLSWSKCDWVILSTTDEALLNGPCRALLARMSCETRSHESLPPPPPPPLRSTLVSDGESYGLLITSTRLRKRVSLSGRVTWPPDAWPPAADRECSVSRSSNDELSTSAEREWPSELCWLLR